MPLQPGEQQRELFQLRACRHMGRESATAGYTAAIIPFTPCQDNTDVTPLGNDRIGSVIRADKGTASIGYQKLLSQKPPVQLHQEDECFEGTVANQSQ